MKLRCIADRTLIARKVKFSFTAFPIGKRKVENIKPLKGKRVREMKMKLL